MHLLLRSAAVAVLLALAPAALAQDLAPRVYPNPISTDRAVTVEVADAAAATVEVVDVLGRVVSSEAPLAAGTYLIRARYADGRVTLPTSVTVASPGPIELRLAETVAPATELAPAPEAPEAAVASKGIACPAGDVLFGGFYHTALTGSLRLRPDLSPQSMRAQPASGGNTVDFTTCFNDVQGYAFRYIAGGDAGNRPLRVLSPAVVGNTQTSFVASYTADAGPAQQALYGTYETFIDNDGNAGTPTVPAVGVGFDADYTTPVRPSRVPHSKGGGGYQFLVFDNQVLVYEGFVSETTPVFVTPTAGATRINLLRSALLSSTVDGFEVNGASAAPGDLKLALTFESGTGANVNFHLGEGAPVVQGTTIHITPTYFFTDPATFGVSQLRTYATGVNRFGTRSLQFAGGGSAAMMMKGPGVLSDGQWARPADTYLAPHVFSVADGQAPIVLVGSAGPVQDYGTQWGREPALLQETGSEAIVLFHEDGTGVPIDANGDFYRTTALVRNETDGQPERITVTVTNIGAPQNTVLVETANGSFTTFEVVYDANNDGIPDNTYDGTVGVADVFGGSSFSVLATGAFDGDDPQNLGSRQDFAIGFLVDLGGGMEAAGYIYPDWTSANADVDVRSLTGETYQPHVITRVAEQDQDDPAPLTRMFSGMSVDR